MEELRCDQERGAEAELARLRDRLAGALIGLARAAVTEQPTAATYRVVREGLCAALPGGAFGKEEILRRMEAVRREKAVLAPGCSTCGCPCGRTEEYDMARLRQDSEDVRALKARILLGLEEMAVCADHAREEGLCDDAVNRFFCYGLFAVGEDWAAEQLLPVVQQLDEVRRRCMALEDKAHPGAPEAGIQ